MKTNDWRALVRKLRKRFPVGSPVVVCRSPAKKNCGMTRFDGRTFRVRIASNQSIQGQVDTLLHEWVHVMAIDQAYRHDGQWGALFASIYDSWTKDFQL